MKYSKETIHPVIVGCNSVSEALQKLGLSKKGGQGELRKLIKSILIQDGTYTGQGHMKNKTYVKIKNEEFFIKSENERNHWNIRTAIFNRGLKERVCERCGNTTWLGNPIPLEVHHKDGDKLNNTLENLEILCPNCHCFTDTYKIKNVK